MKPTSVACKLIILVRAMRQLAETRRLADMFSRGNNPMMLYTALTAESMQLLPVSL
jgi:hypothetical protein